MEMLPGESLRHKLRRDYRLECAAAVDRSSGGRGDRPPARKGFIHGDVKPDNIRLVADGQAMLLDLGFAHRAGENASLLEAGYVLGTVNYLAPDYAARNLTTSLAATSSAWEPRFSSY